MQDYSNLPEKGRFKRKHKILTDNRYILFLGRINYKKGLDILAQAFGILSKQFQDLFLVIVGPDNNYREKLEIILRKQGVIEKVVFTGLLDGDNKLEAYVDAEVFVLSSYSENFGMTVIEAMACGTPVVISNMVGIHREVNKNNAGIVTENSVESLVNAIKLLLDKKELRMEYSENGKKFVNQYYDIEKVADMMITEYENILSV